MSVTALVDRREVTVLVGHPVPGSRTAMVATAVADRVAGARSLPALAPAAVPGGPPAGDRAPAPGTRSVELALHAPEIHRYDAPELDGLRASVTGTDLLIVATPVYKAAYTGLLKSFLDGLGTTALHGTVVVPVIVAGSSAHAVLADLQLRIVLEAVGAALPVPSVLVEERVMAGNSGPSPGLGAALEPLGLTTLLDAWGREFLPRLTATLSSLPPEVKTR